MPGRAMPPVRTGRMSAVRPLTIMLGGSVAAFTALAVARERPTVVRLDTWLERERRDWPSGLEEAGRWLDRLGGHWVLPPVVTAAVLLAWWRGCRGGAAQLVAASLGADLFLHAVKAVVDGDRPGEGTTLPAGASFPSGHATTALTIAVTLALVGTRGRGGTGRIVAVGAAALVAVAVGAGRWLDGLRAASDVVGGLLLGLVWLSAVALLAQWHRGAR